jgi:hypothetical protein
VKVNALKLNLTGELNAEKIAELTDQLLTVRV